MEDVSEEARQRAEDKAEFRKHVDDLAGAYERSGVPRPRRQIIVELRDRSIRRLIEEVGVQLTERQQQNLARYRSIMDELERECDN